MKKQLFLSGLILVTLTPSTSFCWRSKILQRAREVKNALIDKAQKTLNKVDSALDRAAQAAEDAQEYINKKPAEALEKTKQALKSTQLVQQFTEIANKAAKAASESKERALNQIVKSLKEKYDRTKPFAKKVFAAAKDVGRKVELEVFNAVELDLLQLQEMLKDLRDNFDNDVVRKKLQEELNIDSRDLQDEIIKFFKEHEKFTPRSEELKKFLQ